jgi:TolB-like protein/Tfp pilus assembly protein PilF
MKEPEPSSHTSVDGLGPRLDSWKEIASYLDRDVRTVQRWERGEGLPVHRQQHDKLGSVYAFRDEIDGWRAARSTRPEEPSPESPETSTGGDATPPWAPELPPQAITPAGPVGVRRNATRFTLISVALVLIVLAGWLTVRQIATGRSAPLPEITSIVVLPLDNLSTDPAQEFVAAGLTEEITARLAQFTKLRVVSRTTAMSLRDRKLPVSAIAKELDIDAIVEGSVRREAGRLRISIQLIHAASDTHLWARDFEREAGATWPLQIEVAAAVADAIRVQATPAERVRLTAARSVSGAAHEEYMLGRYLLWKFIEDDRVRAIEHFERAIELQPDYAAPYAALAHAWWMRGAFGPLSLRQVATPAREAAMAALARDDGNVEAYAALAYVQGMLDWDWSSARTTIQRAVTLEPNNVDARYVGSLLLMALGRLDEAVAEIDSAVRLDPLSAQVHSTYGRILYRAGRLDEARVRLERSLELEPRNPRAYGRLAGVLEQLGHYDQALALVDKMEALSGRSAEFSCVRARILARAGRASEARRILAQVPPETPERAEVLAALGDRDGAVASLFRALDERESWLLFIKTDPIFEGLHTDPRWTAVLRRMNLE